MWQVIISLAFQQRLTEHLHERYLSNRVYYVASTLRGLSNADQVSKCTFLDTDTHYMLT